MYFYNLIPLFKVGEYDTLEVVKGTGLGKSHTLHYEYRV